MTDIDSVSDRDTDKRRQRCHMCPRKMQWYETRRCRMHLLYKQARQLCTTGMSDVLRFQVNDRVINECASADVNSISCSAAAAAAAGRLR